MSAYYHSVEKVYDSLDECIIIGLTGRTGSGCSTAASILETECFSDLDLASPKRKDFIDVEERKDAVIYKFMKNKWEPFVTIEVSSIILSMAFQQTYDKFTNYIKDLSENNEEKSFNIRGYDELMKRLEGVKSYFDSEYAKYDEKTIDENKIEEYYQYFTKEIKNQKKIFANLLNDYSCYESLKKGYEKQKDKKSQLYTFLLQSFGNNIRCSGDPFKSEFKPECFSKTAERIVSIINLIRRYHEIKYNEDKKELENAGKDASSARKRKTRICIDAIRNPYESFYLKDKFSCYYLVSVSTDDEERRKRLTGFDKNELKSLDDMEYPSDMKDGKIFFQQSIEECLQIADIHLYNPHSNDKSRKLLTKNMVRYIALMIHPGIVTPTNIERCMQVAFTAKLNSGCLSRQVGSVITDGGYYIKAIGWNEVPQCQISCGLRTIHDYISDRDSNTFSKFELEDSRFNNAIENIRDEYDKCTDCDMKKYSITYCFKDIYNAIDGNKNQVYTRSLHAEENSFLQASKFGGQGIQGGKLFVTASPCELCSKKSYQLGIRDIYYIDPYPGIAGSHILKLGKKPTNPNLHIFYGAIGSAYVAMYTKRFSTKDELQLLSGVDMKKVAVKSKPKADDDYKHYKYKTVYLELKFHNRYNIEFINKSVVIPIYEPIIKYTKTLSWTGSSYEKTESLDKNPAYKISDEDLGDGIYNILFHLDSTCDVNQEFAYNFRTIVKDDQEIMSPFLSYHVKGNTEKLELCVRFKKDEFEVLPQKFQLILYADRKKDIIYDIWDRSRLKISEEDGYYVVRTEEIPSPNLLYNYTLEWDWQTKKQASDKK